MDAIHGQSHPVSSDHTRGDRFSPSHQPIRSLFLLECQQQIPSKKIPLSPPAKIGSQDTHIWRRAEETLLLEFRQGVTDPLVNGRANPVGIRLIRVLVRLGQL